MRNTLQQDAKEAFEKVCGKKSEAKEVEHMTLEGMQKELKENTKHQMEYVNELKNKSLKNFVNSLFILVSLFLGNIYLKYCENSSFCIGKFSAADAPAPKKIVIFIKF